MTSRCLPLRRHHRLCISLACTSRSNLCGSAQCLVSACAELDLIVRACWIDHNIGGDGLPAKQHTVAHRGPVCEADFYRPAAASDFRDGCDDDPPVFLAVGADYFALIDDARGAINAYVGPQRDWRDLEVHDSAIWSIGQPNVAGVQCRRSCTGIDLGFDCRKSQLRQCQPFLPAEKVGSIQHGLPGVFREVSLAETCNEITGWDACGWIILNRICHVC